LEHYEFMTTVVGELSSSPYSENGSIEPDSRTEALQ
jgi:hypothetical protein